MPREAIARASRDTGGRRGRRGRRIVIDTDYRSMSNGGGWFYRAMHREPVVMWSCMIGALGLALPLVVPRDAFGGEPTTVRAPPSAAAVVRALKPQRGAGGDA